MTTVFRKFPMNNTQLELTLSKHVNRSFNFNDYFFVNYANIKILKSWPNLKKFDFFTKLFYTNATKWAICAKVTAKFQPRDDRDV